MKRLIAAACVAAAFEAAPAAPRGTNDVAVLPPVVVYASRIGDAADTMPAPVKVFTADEVAAVHARSLPELLDRAANLQVRTLNANPLQSEIALRGFGANSSGRVKLIADGEELNGVDMETPNLARLPVDGIERVEVIPGPSPVLYGDGAVAGVVSVTTDSRDYAPRTRLAAHGGSYGAAGADFRTRGGSETNGLLYSASYGYDRSDGYRSRSGYDLHAFNAALRRNSDNGATAGLKTGYFNALYQMPGALAWEEWKSDPRQARYDHDSCRLWNYGFAFDGKAPAADDQWLLIDAAFSVKHRTSRWGDYGCANDYDLYSYRFSPRYVNEMPVFGLDSKATAGVDFTYDRYDVTDRSGFGAPDSAFDRVHGGLFAREELYLLERLSLVGGARGELIDNRWSNDPGLRETHSRDLPADFELALVCRPADGLKTFLKGTRFHRSPYCDEMNYTEDGSFLVPETGTSLDLGLDARFAREFRFDLDGYWTLVDDEIFYDPHAKDYGGRFGGYNCNSPGRTERLGVDTGFDWRREKTAEASVRYAFANARFVSGDYAGETVPLVPQSRVRIEAGVWVLEDLELKGGCRCVSSQYLAGDFGNDHGTLPAYAVFDASAVYEPRWTRGWKAVFTVDNLFDRNYCDYAGWSEYAGAYFYPACGRSFRLSLSYEF